MRDKKLQLDLLRIYFEKHKNITFAFLFGSRVNKAHSGSDWDIGVYFNPKDREMEWEEQREWPEEKIIFADMTSILKTDNIDLVVLNRAPSHIADIIVRKGLPLIIKDRVLFLEFLLKVSAEAEDYRNMVEEYYDIYQRSASLSKEDRVSLEKRIVFLENELKDFSYYKKYTFELYERDVHKKRELERWIENIINAIVDISKIVISSNKAVVPESYRESVEKMFLVGVDKDILSLLAGWVRLRNILAHEYLDMRWKSIRDFLDKGESVCGEFLASVKRLLN